MKEEKIPSLCNRVGTNRSFSWWAITMIILFFSGILILLFVRSPLSKIQEIVVQGNELLLEDQINDKVAIKLGSSLLSVNVKKVEQALLTLPEIKEVEVHRGLNKIYINVKEKRVVGLVISGSSYYPFLEDGSVMKKNYHQLSTYGKPILEGWSFPNKLLQEATLNLTQLPRDILSKVCRIRPVENSSEKVQISTRKHHKIIVRAKDIDEKLRIYPSFYDHPPGEIFLLESVWYRKEKHTS